MTQTKSKLWSGLTATLLVTTWSATLAPSHASSLVDDDSVNLVTQVSTPEDSSEDSLTEATEPSEASARDRENSVRSSRASDDADAELASPTETPPSESDDEVVKVGEYQSQEQAGTSEEAIANILPHDMDGRYAATLYVRNIPVLTFLGSTRSSETSVPQASQVSTPSTAHAAHPAPSGEEVKVASVQLTSEIATAQTDDVAFNESDPVLRATAIAATLNQLHRRDFDAAEITVKWDTEQEAYLIQMGEDPLVQINGDTILPDTTRNPAEDALQATNRLRRQMGDAPPLNEIEGAPRPSSPSLVSAVRSAITGMASWYGPGFHGNYSASGEVFNQNALTAAHPSLPFGTYVRVTNLDNGLDVTVRINDRGPYTGGRVIDLSMAAARVIGLVNAGVAPVQVEVLDSVASGGSGR
jgi:rare lipoprotein A